MRAAQLYDQIATQARDPLLYTTLETPDSVMGRFEQTVLHAYVVFRALKNSGPKGAAMAQRVFDVMFESFDDALRELGVGDLSVGKKIRAMAENFYGRVGAYEKALDESDDHGALAAALSRHIYDVDAHACAPALAAYIRKNDRLLPAQVKTMCEQGVVTFAPLTEVLSTFNATPGQQTELEPNDER